MKLKLHPGEHIEWKFKNTEVVIIPNIKTSITLYPGQFILELKKGKVVQVHKTKNPITVKLDPLSQYVLLDDERQLLKWFKKAKNATTVKLVHYNHKNHKRSKNPKKRRKK